MTRRDPRHRRTWVMVTDGERALQRRVARDFHGVTLVLDLLHVMEKLWKAAYVFHPENSPEARSFVYQRAERILSGQVSQVVKGLRQMATKRHLHGREGQGRPRRHRLLLRQPGPHALRRVPQERVADRERVDRDDGPILPKRVAPLVVRWSSPTRSTRWSARG